MSNTRMKKKVLSLALATITAFTTLPGSMGTIDVLAKEDKATSQTKATEEADGSYTLSNDYFSVNIGKYGQIRKLYIVGDKYPTNYVMNEENAPAQGASSTHQWMGELMLATKFGDGEYKEGYTSQSDSDRTITLNDNKVIVTYSGKATEAKGINGYQVEETYTLVNDRIKWDIEIENKSDEVLTVGDLGLPITFNEYWSGGDEIYETRVVDHSFVGKNSSYIYAIRPSGQGQYVLLTPDDATDASFEYQDHWRVEERAANEKSWCQDQDGWASGLNVFYIHSDVIKKTNRGYLDNTSLKLKKGESKKYSFDFSPVDNEEDMKSTLYEEGIIDAVAVPGMTFAKNMPAKMYLHTKYAAKDLKVNIKCPHELNLFDDNKNSVSNNLPCEKSEAGTYAKYESTKLIDGEQYHIYDISFDDLGQNDVVVYYDNGTKETELQFYIMDDVSEALNTHSQFMIDKTQWDAEGELYDKVFDDWMMDTKSKRGVFNGYWGWGDDWGLTHGEYIAEKNVYIPVEKEITAIDEYLDTAIWHGLMQEHQEDYLIHDFQMKEPNDTPTYRGYAYPHIYNTYYSMYKIASKYPDIVEYIEDKDTYLLRAYNIMKALYTDGVYYNWSTGVMGELTTPDIIGSLKAEGYTDEAAEIEDIMVRKYKNFSSTKYPYGSEYSYDNTGEEAVYTLAKLNLGTDEANALSMMQKIDLKTRACRGLQPVWYHYANPTTICGESWWNFQYTAALAGYCMDDYLRLENNGLNSVDSAKAERVNYAAKLANLTCINSGQIDADPENIGTVAWTYQSEMGNLGGQGTGGGKIHNGWRQMAGEADLGLFGALQILSADVATDPVFGLFGYGCNVADNGDSYSIKPLDGLNTRLNLIDDGCYVELDRDRYVNAIITKDCSDVKLTVTNLEKTEHNTDINLTGFADGCYTILVDGKERGTFKAAKNQTVTVSVPLGKKDTSEVEFKIGAAAKNTAPIVDAGNDIETYLPEVDGIDEATIVIDFNLSANQENGTRLIEFGDLDENYLYVSFKGNNQLSIAATDMKSKKLKTVDTVYAIAPEYDKKLVLTNDNGNIAAYLDGDKIATLDSGFVFSDLGDAQRNYLGRSHEESISFLNGKIKGFSMYSKAFDEEEISKLFGDLKDREIVSIKDAAVVTKINEAPKLPKEVSALYSDGVYRNVEVKWDEVSAESYGAKGVFTVEGSVDKSTVKAKANVVVVDGKEVNLAAYATPSAIVNTPQDLGGVAGLNDGYDPSASNDTSHGVWHNWLGGAQGAPAWVTYTWDDEVIITGQDAYYFKDNGGNFSPAAVKLEYLEGDEWKECDIVEGLGTELDKYNTTTIKPIQTTALRMTLNPKTLGCGVIEWKVYGFKEGAVDKSGLNSAISRAEKIDPFFVKSGYADMKSILAEAKELVAKMGVSQKELDEIADRLNSAVNSLDMDTNLALDASVSTSYVSSWETLGAVNDGVSSSASMEKPATGAYGSWGNTSEYETITYTWDKKISISKSAIYFWKDNDSEEVVGIQFPKNYTISYKDGDDWKEVKDASGYGLEADKYNVTSFKPVMTDGLRIQLNKKEANNSGVGVIEWAVLGGEPVEEELEELEKEDVEELLEKDVESEEKKEEKDSDIEEASKVPTEEATEKDAETTEENTDEVESVTAEDSKLKVTTDEVVPEEKLTELEVATGTNLLLGAVATTRLRASAIDDGYPNSSLEYKWTVKSKPNNAAVAIDKDNQAITDVSFNQAGNYVLTLTVSDGELSSSDDIKIKVAKGDKLPEKLCEYDFGEKSLDKKARLVKDINDTGYDSSYSYNPNPVFAAVDGVSFIDMAGGFCGYVKLTDELTKGKIKEDKTKEPIINPVNPFKPSQGGSTGTTPVNHEVNKAVSPAKDITVVDTPKVPAAGNNKVAKTTDKVKAANSSKQKPEAESSVDEKLENSKDSTLEDSAESTLDENNEQSEEIISDEETPTTGEKKDSNAILILILVALALILVSGGYVVFAKILKKGNK
ncbi:DUF5695 domain-containing protein [Pseudobutyrivibrio ruminis]|uniref:DUF5695 domain-containing protein n=1 Tax=Pseudobutyrivibrio ruminis TaxID=46206 RepID=UPI0003FC0C2C|nr:DUF5695 domain-containing protein [Pseudobutyrivibrio ruminis]